MLWKIVYNPIWLIYDLMFIMLQRFIIFFDFQSHTYFYRCSYSLFYTITTQFGCNCNCKRWCCNAAILKDPLANFDWIASTLNKPFRKIQILSIHGLSHDPQSLGDLDDFSPRPIIFMFILTCSLVEFLIALQLF